MYKKRGQASTEMMVVLGLVFILLAFILTVNESIMTGIEGEYNSRKAKIALDKIVHAGKLAYQQGEGAELKIYITIPPNVESIVMNGREINLTMNINGERHLIYRLTDYNITRTDNITGTVPPEMGSYWLRIKAGQKYVNITNYYG